MEGTGTGCHEAAGRLLLRVAGVAAQHHLRKRRVGVKRGGELVEVDVAGEQEVMFEVEDVTGSAGGCGPAPQLGGGAAEPEPGRLPHLAVPGLEPLQDAGGSCVAVGAVG